MNVELTEPLLGREIFFNCVVQVFHELSSQNLYFLLFRCWWHQVLILLTRRAFSISHWLHYSISKLLWCPVPLIVPVFAFLEVTDESFEGITLPLVCIIRSGPLDLVCYSIVFMRSWVIRRLTSIWAFPSSSKAFLLLIFSWALAVLSPCELHLLFQGGFLFELSKHIIVVFGAPCLLALHHGVHTCFVLVISGTPPGLRYVRFHILRKRIFGIRVCCLSFHFE